ncbi:unnamed protein product [Closterium sp. Naga37s-1]|nr:unnamed protein product [Closterium sp. Naga37s-1]
MHSAAIRRRPSAEFRREYEYKDVGEEYEEGEEEDARYLEESEGLVQGFGGTGVEGWRGKEEVTGARGLEQRREASHGDARRTAEFPGFQNCCHDAYTEDEDDELEFGLPIKSRSMTARSASRYSAVEYGLEAGGPWGSSDQDHYMDDQQSFSREEEDPEAAAPVRQVVKLGFLLPYPKADNVIPVRLADEWIAASRVALEVLGPKYSNAFDVVPHIANSNCDRQEAKEAAQLLLRDGVVGVVGPACTEAALGAADVLVPAGVPIVSFAATWDGFRDRERFGSFFRTVFGDRHQAAAMRSLLQEFVFDRVILFFTEDTYGSALGYDIEYFARSDNLTVHSIPVPVPCLNYSSLFLNVSDPSPSKPLIQADDSTVVVLAVSPNAAEGIWRAALDLGRLEYPWWYFGTDGAVAFDPVGEGQNLTALASALQGEMGVAPYKGDYSNSSPIWEYIMHWRTKRHDIYPGLLTLDVGPSLPRFNTTRQYVPYLFDAVHSFFEAFSSIIANQNAAPTTELVLACFKGVPRGCINFTGTTGQVRRARVRGGARGRVLAQSEQH